ncbi:DNA cross-link repair 1A protein, partial [Eschrichtius robustus]|nr:DNA cross-link repair 1A protein [Eschrichtius robustus]
MLEDAFLEQDIWEYKSKRKPKPVHANNCSENIPKSVEKATDGQYQSKRNRNKKRTVEGKKKVKAPETCLGETDSQTSVVSSQNSSCGDGVQQCQDREATPGKHCRTHKNKHVSPKIRPVYDGYCPNCQMPFSSLLGQTPRWHVFECLDSVPVSETECPDALQCSSTIPSHYKRYTHLLLAQSRASNCPFSDPSHESGGSFSETNSGFLCSLKERWSPCQKQTDNLKKNVSTDPLLVTQCLGKSQSPTETDKKVSSSTNIQTSQQVPQFTELVNDDKLVGFGLPLAEELDSQNSPEHINLTLPENDFSNCEISYSPLQSDEETYDTGEKLDDSQQELFFTESSKDGSLEGDVNSSTLSKQLHGPLLKDQEESCPEVDSFLTQEKYDEEFCPGAVMILFYLPNGYVILHTGDFRADPTMERSLLAGQKVHTLYLDTTYCSPEYSFPSQQEVIQFAVNTAFETVTLNPRALVVCGTYSIGKEKVFLAIADVLGSKVGMSKEKYNTLQCFNIPEINSLITTDMCNSLVHLLPMMQINFK